MKHFVVLGLFVAGLSASQGVSAQPGTHEDSAVTVPGPTTDPTVGPDAVEQLRSFDIVAISVAERRAVLRQGEELRVVTLGDPLPGLGGAWLRQVRADRLTVQLPGGRVVHWYAVNDTGGGAAEDSRGFPRLEVISPTAPPNARAASPPYLIPIRRAAEPSSDAESDAGTDAGTDADSEVHQP